MAYSSGKEYPLVSRELVFIMSRMEALNIVSQALKFKTMVHSCIGFHQILNLESLIRNRKQAMPS
ncbi:hypothetical protein J1N35_029380 [Gossypium stocksii]|uniref:Uncharacterized protein n=1 Tax=Gossypium stocksii TaxID=47602 RepID=A0A9D3UXZ2_9ROSI|nr:hypothetical protein J1N35_029380 [Gossypium stocksii]